MSKNAFPRIRNVGTDEIVSFSGRVVTFGSANDCHVMISDRKVASRAAHCIFTGGGYNIQPLDHGQVRINNLPLRGGHRLAHGDKITIGGAIFEYQENEITDNKITRDPSSHPVEDLISVVVMLLRNRGADVSEELVASVSRLMRCDAARLLTEDEQSGERKTIARYPAGAGLDRFSVRAIDWAKSAGKTVLVADIADRGAMESMTSLERNQVASVMCAPLIASDHSTILGYLYLDRLRDRNTLFTEEDRNFCDTLVPLFTEILSNANRHTRQAETIARLQSAQPSRSGILFESAEMGKVIEQAQKIAKTDSPALVLGKTGTGKELMARFIHEHSGRSDKPFKAINCGAIPENLIESELFGHEKGAFTGANQRKTGLFEAAHTGTVFLDEVGELPVQLQVKLLRVLQESEIVRVGGTESIGVDIRIIAATNRNLEREVAEGRFRQDLYFRLHVLALTLPPLVDRGQDIILLAHYFIGRYSDQFGISRKALSSAARNKLLTYGWPGNIRELENVIQKAVLLSGKRIEESDIVFTQAAVFGDDSPCDTPQTLKDARNQAESRAITKALSRTGGNISMASKILQIDRKWLMRKMDELDISADTYRGRNAPPLVLP